MEVVVPAAGLSSRFPGKKPKYLRYDFKGFPMIRLALEPFLRSDVRIHVGILKEHNEEFDAEVFLRNELPGVNIVELTYPTLGPADTVFQMLTHLDFGTSGFLVKDCDGSFVPNVLWWQGTPQRSVANGVFTTSISPESKGSVSNKSFCVINDQRMLVNIVEKRVVSDTYCVGGYAFSNSQTFMAHYERLSEGSSNEVFVSHVVQSILSLGHEPFEAWDVVSYADFGTFEEWQRWNNRPVVLCDIDGTLIHAQGRYGRNSYDSQFVPLIKNVEAILRMQSNGSQIIFLTSRPEWARAATITTLESLGFSGFDLVMNLNNSARILINDFDESNPYPRAESINIRRNTDVLGEFLPSQ